MAKNIEIKAYAADFRAQEKIAAALSDSELEVIKQTDAFFNVETGRLKLREFSDSPSQLIFYIRQDQTGPKLSEYYISENSAPKELKIVLEKAYGLLAVVSKTRHLYLAGRTRIHFDRVDQLGEFIELEVVLGDSDSLVEGELEAQRLMEQLGILPDHLIDKAYVDLLKAQQGSLLKSKT